MKSIPKWLGRLLERLPLPQLLARTRLWLSHWQDLVGIFLLLVTLEIGIASIERANWISPQPSLTTVLVLAVLTTSILARMPLPGAVPHVLILATGLGVTVWQAANLIPDLETTSKVSQLITTLYYWYQTTSAGQSTADTAHFVVFLALFTWILGYLATWFYWRARNAWVAVLPGTIAILLNLSNLTEKHYGFFFVYLVAAMLFVGHTSLMKRYLLFRKDGITYPARSMTYIMVSVLCLSVALVSLAWAVPAVPTKTFDLTSEAPFRRDVDDLLARFFAGIAVQQPYLSSSGQRTLSFIDPIDRSYTVHFVISTKRPFYWRTRAYNLYTSRGWTTTQTTDNLSGLVFPGGEPEKLLNRGPLTNVVIPKVKTDILPSAGEFISSDSPVSIEALTPPTFAINLMSPLRERLLPPDVANLARTLRFLRSSSKTFTWGDLQGRLPEDTVLSSIGESREAPSEASFNMLTRNRRLAALEVARKPGARDILAAVSAQLINPDQRIRVTASISTATPADLSQAGEKYPNHITDFYLQLPTGLPERVRQLARTSTREAVSPYQKAVAVRNYLQRFPYSNAVDNPPGVADGVDYFLFTLQEGNCFYFASSMAVMLRSVGIPARLVAGYLPGEWDEANGVSIVRAKDYHSWVEVYFPRYGWVEFDPTPSAIGSEPAIYDDDILLEEESTDETLSDSGDFVIPFEWPEFNISLPTLYIPIALLVILLGSAVYVWQRYFAGLDYVSSMYARVCFVASLARLGCPPHLTPLEYSVRLTAAFPAQAGAISDIAQVYIASRFGRVPPSQTGLRRKLGRSWRDLYPALLKRLFLLG